MNIKKKVLTGTMVMCIGLSSFAGVYASKVNEDSKKSYGEFAQQYNTLYGDDIVKANEVNGDKLIAKETETDNFNDFAKYILKQSITDNEKKKVKDLYEKAIEFKKEGKLDEAAKVWDQIYSLNLTKEGLMDKAKVAVIDAAIGDAETKEEKIEEITAHDKAVINSFEDFAKHNLKDSITDAEKNQVKVLFDKAVKLKEENKYEEEGKAWAELYALNLTKEGIMDNEKSTVVDAFSEGDTKEESAKETIEDEKPAINSFEDFAKYMLKDSITVSEKNQAKVLFDKAVKLKEEGKHEAAKAWEELYSLDIFKDKIIK